MSAMATDRRSLLVGLAAIGLPARLVSAVPRRWRWGVDYSATSDPVVARDFDLLVLEPDHSRSIAPLRGPGSRLLGYISLGEIERSRPFVDQLDRAEALRAPNPNWPDARLVDLRHPAWRSLVLDQLIPAILAKGYDGIFMDTLDNAEAMEQADPSRNGGMVAAAVDVVRAIRARFPGITIMMNRGYALLPQSAKFVDLVLGEAMATRWNFKTSRYEFTSPEDWTWQADRLRGAKRANPALELATLDYWEPTDEATVTRLYARERAAGFQPYVATLALDRLIPEPQS